MIAPAHAVNELERLDALDRYAILDTAPEEAFDELVKLASIVCDAPVALISLVDRTRQWFKARVGLAAVETSRDVSFCGHAVLQRDLFIVPDTLADVRFADNPLVASEPHMRFYAGAPLTTPDGLNLGTLCVIDRKPRVLTDDQAAALRALARQVMVQLELRRQIAERYVAEAKLQRVLAETQLDISRRHKAERELDRFFDVSLDLLCIASFDGYFRRLNPAFEEVLGYTVEELVSRPFLELVHPDDRGETTAEVARLRKGVTTTHFENRYVHKDGSVRWIAWTASPVPEEELIYAAGRDITRAKSAEQELRRSEARTRSILDNALGSLVATDAQGVIETVNPAAERTFGYSSDELVGRPLEVLVASPSFDTLRDGVRGRVTECHGHKKTGERFTCEISLFEFYAADDQRHFAAHILDVSERHEVERMKNDFISTVSHELRTPLTSIRGSLGLLASGAMGELPEGARPMMSVAERNSVRLISLINDILDFDRLESGKMEMDLRATPLLRVLERSIESVSAMAAQEEVNLELHCANALVMVDEARMAQVVVNLLSNAVKYSDPGGMVQVTAAVEDGWVEVRVADRGRGIAPELQSKLFQRFHRVDSSDARTKPGTGLGLSICKAIIEQHGGTIGVKSSEEEGSTFWFRIRAAG